MNVAHTEPPWLRRIYKLWSDIFEAIEAQPFPEDGDSSLGAGIRRLQASKEGQAFSRKDLQHTAIGLLIAGLDSQALTTSFTLCAPAPPCARRRRPGAAHPVPPGDAPELTANGCVIAGLNLLAQAQACCESRCAPFTACRPRR